MRTRVLNMLIEELESGNYKKGRSLLKYKKNGVVYHCIIGVLLEIYQKTTNSKRGKFIFDEKTGVYSFLGYTQGVPTRVIEWSNEDLSTLTDLMELNDNCRSFKPIIKELKSNPIFQRKKKNLLVL